jgi:hypothetical protein
MFFQFVFQNKMQSLMADGALLLGGELVLMVSSIAILWL